MILSTVALWALLAVGFLVLEACTVAMVSLWFAIGAAAALVLSLLGAAFWIQTAAFLVVSGVLLALLRPMMRKYVKITKTNVDSVLGMDGLVTESIDNVAYQGQVKLGGMTWSARSTSGAPISVGSLVTVDRVEGVKVFVSPAKVPSETNAN
ncbi:MAG: NfeD family protein [Candidatus Faecousia sp.]|nr:NfeD family protein [Candidatus Faecousia sp.]